MHSSSFVLVFFFFFADMEMQKRRRRLLHTLSPFPCLRGTHSAAGTLPFLRKYKAKEIERATDGFCAVLGSCSDGKTVYRARFPNGEVAAVRKAASSSQELQGAFHLEVQLLGCLHHRHILRLQGFSEGNTRYLIFDHMQNGSLKDYFHDPLRTPLNWRTRLQIAVDVAAALEYLYCFCGTQCRVFVSSSNVMLDENFVAKLSEVCFQKICIDNESNDTCCSKDCFRGAGKNVVFQFGILILELVTGRSLGGGDEETVQWVQDLRFFARSMNKMVDADLGDDYDSDELRSLLIAARLCTQPGEENAVSIPQMHRYLQGKLESCTEPMPLLLRSRRKEKSEEPSSLQS